MTAAEVAPRLALLAAICIGASVYTFAQSPATPLGLVFATMYRPIAWFGLIVGCTAALGAVLAWRRAARHDAAFRQTGLTRADLKKLSPEQFEQWCAARLREQGFRVSEVGGQGDHGVDLIAERGEDRIVVQCKRWFGVRLVGEPQVRDLYGAMHHESATGAMVITTGVFSEPALAWARGKNMQLWDVERLIGGTPLAAITATAITAASARPCPRCNGTLVRRVARRNQQPFFGCSTFPRCRYTQPI